jgi:hypothetical protein
MVCGSTATVSVYQGYNTLGLGGGGGNTFACIEKVLDNENIVGSWGVGSLFSWVAKIGEQYYVLVSPPYAELAAELESFQEARAAEEPRLYPRGISEAWQNLFEECSWLKGCDTAFLCDMSDSAKW